MARAWLYIPIGWGGCSYSKEKINRHFFSFFVSRIVCRRHWRLLNNSTSKLFSCIFVIFFSLRCDEACSCCENCYKWKLHLSSFESHLYLLQLLNVDSCWFYSRLCPVFVLFFYASWYFHIAICIISWLIKLSNCIDLFPRQLMTHTVVSKCQRWSLRCKITIPKNRRGTKCGHENVSNLTFTYQLCNCLDPRNELHT